MKFKSKVRVSLIAFAIFIIAGSCLTYVFRTAKDLAAWVQAIGSIAAILAAIAVAWYQAEVTRERDRQDREADLRGLLLSVRDELFVNLTMAHEIVGKELEETAPGTIYFGIFPVPEDPFVIFNSLSHKLPMITNERLRLQIIKTYAIAKGVAQTFRFNNTLLSNYEITRKIARKSEEAVDVVEAELIEVQLCDYGDSLRAHYKKLMAEADTLNNLFREMGM